MYVHSSRLPAAGFAGPQYLRPAYSRRPARVVRVPLCLHRAGLGDSSTGSKLIGGVTSGAVLGAQTAIATGSNVAGAVAGGLVAAAPFTGPGAPFLLAAAALVGPVASLFKGCGQTCTMATKYINDATAAANKIRDAYFAQPVRYRSSQAGALAYIDQLKQYVMNSCGNPALGDAGQRCINENLVRGYKSAWCPAGGCGWNELIIDPIANDTGVVPDPVLGSAVGSSLLESLGVSASAQIGGIPIADLLLPAALLALAVLI